MHSISRRISGVRKPVAVMSRLGQLLAQSFGGGRYVADQTKITDVSAPIAALLPSHCRSARRGEQLAVSRRPVVQARAERQNQIRLGSSRSPSSEANPPELPT